MNRYKSACVSMSHRKLLQTTMSHHKTITTQHKSAWTPTSHHDSWWFIMTHHDSSWFIIIQHESARIMTNHHKSAWISMNQHASTCSTKRRKNQLASLLFNVNQHDRTWIIIKNYLDMQNQQYFYHQHHCSMHQLVSTLLLSANAASTARCWHEFMAPWTCCKDIRL